MNMMPLNFVERKTLFSKTDLTSKVGDWRAADFSPLKIQQKKRQGKEKESNVHVISKPSAIALQC